MTEQKSPSDQTLGLRELKKRQSRTAMHRAALELVGERGLSGVTVEEIAQRAGVSTRTFFNHWATKESAILGIASAGEQEIGEELRRRAAEEEPLRALRAVMREAVASAPHDLELRELKREIMLKEPKLHSISTGNLRSVQTEMIDVLSELLEGEDAHERAMLAVQIGFAVTRTAFGISMIRGIELGEAFDEVAARYDGADPVF